MDALSDRRALEGRTVVLTGRLASMTHEEAARRVADAGGRVEREPGAHTDLVVVGQGGPPLDDDGEPTRALVRARELRASGGRPEVVHEEVLLERLGIEGFDLERRYTTEQLRRILGVERRELRAWMRAGLVRPVQVQNRLALFDFRQVASARSLVQLVRAGVGPGRLRASLARMEGWLAHPETALTQIERLEGGALAVRTADGALAEPSGQLRLDFEAPGGSSAATGIAPSRVIAGPAPRDVLDRGLDAEAEGRLEDAAELYRAALEAGDPRAEISFNLGNVRLALGRAADAAGAFLEAVERDASFVEAWNNFGIALDAVDRRREAVLAYTQALAVEPDYADAHYNLGDTLAALGDHVGAARHWTRYLGLDPVGRAAASVRARLADLSRG